MFRAPVEADMDLKLAARAHYGTSHTPDVRARDEVEYYINAVHAFRSGLMAFADTPEKVEFADEVT
ncbi:MAG: hypothetical protein E5W44_07200, partial [Mesorhizobium sp.]